jgi:predicted dehydrogenase
LEYPSGASAHFRSSFALPEMTFTMHLQGTEGEALAHNFVVSALDNRITVVSGGESRVEHLGDRSTYTYQLEAFADHVRNGTAIPTGSDDALLQAQLIDACYEAAGLPLRPTADL